MFTRVFKFVRVWEFLIICESLREFAKVCKSYWVWNIFRFQKFLRVFELLRVFECLRVFESLRVFKSKSFWKFSRVFEFLRGFDSFWEFSKVFENFHILFNESTRLMRLWRWPRLDKWLERPFVTILSFVSTCTRLSCCVGLSIGPSIRHAVEFCAD